MGADRQKPNVLLVTLDQFRAECIGVAGHPLVRTPTLDRLSREGVRFSHHFSNCAPCSPGRASLLTGLWQMNHRVTENGTPLADDLPMLARLLREIGYRPTLFGYTDTALDPRGRAPDDPALRNWEEALPGFDVALMLDEQIEPWIDWLAESGVVIEDPPWGAYRQADVAIPPGRGATWPPPRHDADHTESAFLSDRAIEWFRNRSEDPTPWCVHLSYLRPHPPYIVPAPYNDMYDPADVPPPHRLATLAEQAAVHPFLEGALSIIPSPAHRLDQDQLRATYFGMITEVDAQLGRVIDELAGLGQLDSTIVVVTSDHGEQLGDHWLVEKTGFYDPSYRIPLIIRWPGMQGRPGRVVDAFTENVDVLPTLLDVCGGEIPTFSDGASLREFLDRDIEGTAAPDRWRQEVIFEYDFHDPRHTMIEQLYGLRQDECSISVIRDRSGKYVHFGGRFPPLLFDLESDPGELDDLAPLAASDPAVAARMLDYAGRMLSLRMQHADPRLTGTRITPDGPVVRPDPPRPAIERRTSFAREGA
ncbi:MAG: alkaline phosphatase family protein [Actinobacteria bacterium]|nr:alkaline phosphatase family protein [Actinomycetota bacterium]